MRKIIIGIWLIIILVFGVPEAFAQCHCSGGTRENDYRGNLKYRTAFDEFKDSAAVFIGEFVEEKKIKIPPPYKGYNFSYEYKVKFMVKRAWKKNLEETIIVRIEASCLIGFEKDEEYLVYAFVDKKNMLRINYCSRTRLIAKASSDLKEFEEKGEKPVKINEPLPLKP